MVQKDSVVRPGLFSRRERLCVALLFSFLWLYLFLRACYLPLLHDEIATFFYYVQSDVFMPPHAHWDANNHVLNSALSNWSYHLFGQSPLALRLPNVLSFPLYFFGVAGLASRLRTVWLRWSFMGALLLSTYLFEYLSECRGYGLSMALLMMSLFMVVRLVETGKHGYTLLTGILLFFATAANLTLLISSVLIFGFMFGQLVLGDVRSNWKRATVKIFWLILTGAPFLLLVKLSLLLKEKGLLYYGSQDGFLAVTLPSLLKQFLGGSGPFLEGIIALLAVATVLVSLVFFALRRGALPGHLLTVYLLAGSVCCIFLLARFLGVNYPEDRTAMYLYPYFIMAFLYTLNAVSGHYKWIQALALPVFVVPVFFMANLSLTGSVFSSEERHSQKIFDLINARPWESKFPATVGGYRTQEFCWFYMNNTAGGHQGRLHWTNHPGIDADFQLVSTQFRFNPSTYRYYDSIYCDASTGLVLFERRNKLPRKLLQVSDIPKTENNSAGFYNLGVYDLDSLRNKTLFVGAEMTLDSKSSPFTARLVAGVDDSSGKNIVYEYIPLHWLRKNYSGETNNVLQGTLIHEVPNDAVSMTFYLWNINEEPFSIRDGKCYLYSLERDF